MNIAIIGFGSMGTKIKEIAEIRGHKVNITIDPKNPEATCLVAFRDSMSY